MIRRRNSFSRNRGVSPVWVSFSDLFSQLAFIAIVISVLMGLEYKLSRDVISRYIQENKTLEDENRSLTWQMAGLQQSKLSVSGSVIFPPRKPDSSLKFIIKENSYAVDESGRFVIDSLDPGSYIAVLWGEKYKEKAFRFQISSGGFDGFNVHPGDVIDESEASISDLPEGLVIKEITEEYVRFDKGKFQITPKGQQFLREQFAIHSTDGLTPLERLNRDADLKIVVVGQADPDPVDPLVGYSNIGLSALRASAVADYITDKLGFRNDQVIVMGLGSAESWLPVKSSSMTRDDYFSRCRRVLIMYSENSEDTLLNRIRKIGDD
jgi:outer membrane protein OmpA-like peptidoglycan-associated protein